MYTPSFAGGGKPRPYAPVTETWEYLSTPRRLRRLRGPRNSPYAGPACANKQQADRARLASHTLSTIEDHPSKPAKDLLRQRPLVGLSTNRQAYYYDEESSKVITKEEDPRSLATVSLATSPTGRGRG